MKSSLLQPVTGSSSSSTGNNGDSLPDYVKPNRKDAQEFFLSTLPRRIADPTQKTGHRLAKPGEMRDSNGNLSYLYPLMTNDDALSEFGIGIALYFQTVKALCIVLLLCACFCLIAIFQNEKFNPDDTDTLLKGSVYGAIRDDLKVNHQGVSDIMCCIIICIFAIIAAYFEKKTVTEIDLSQQTTQDYSVECSNPPLNCMDMNVYYDFFSKFGEVVLISIATTNGELLKALADRKAVESTLQGLIAAADAEIKSRPVENRNSSGTKRDASGDMEPRTSSIDINKYDKVQLSFLQRIGFAPTIKSCFKKLHQLNVDIQHLCTQEYEPWRVYVTYNTEEAQRNCLAKTNVGKFSVFMNKVDNEEVLLYGKTLEIGEAPEPDDIIYENSHYRFLRRLSSWVISYVCCGGVLLASFFIIESLSGNGDILVAIFIAIVNAMLPAVLKLMTQLVEIHTTERDVQKSMLLKLVVARCVNSAILIYVATSYEDTFGEQSLGQMQNILIADAVTTPIIRMLNIYDFAMRYIIVPRYAKSQEEYNAAWQGADWNLAERYTDMLKTVFVGLFFSVPLPTGLFISCFAMLSTYLVDKYSLFRIWQRYPSIDHSLGTLSRYFFVLIVFTHLAISRVYFANWCVFKVVQVSVVVTAVINFRPYNDEGNKADCNFFVCDTDDSDMTSDQKKIVDTYSAFSVTMFVVAVAWGILYKIYAAFQQFYHGNTVLKIDILFA